ncbi:MAG TPA: HAMP domain-containing sensor histidine kinase [Candidatus Acidoferrales bacterium]
MTKWWRPNERARLLLTLQLAVCLPAAALIGLSIWKLKSMGRDKVIEATIQRDFAHLLKIADKRITRRAMEMVAEVQGQFPCPDDPVAQKLDKLLEQYPYAAHLFLYDETSGMVFRSQPRRLEEAYFLAESEDLSKMMGGWMRLEAKDLVKKLHKMDRYEGERFAFYANWAPRGEKQGYQSIAFFILPKTPKDRIAFGGLVFDSEFLRDQFFPDALNNLMAEDLAEPNRDKDDYSQPVMMVHIRKEAEPLAASAGWDGGKPEVERNFETAFPGLTLAIKFRGTTVEALGQRFLRTSFLILGGLSLFLAGGIWLTYRNVAREMALAKLKSDFVSNVSHELRTPLSLIRLFAETLEMGRLKSQDKYQEYFRIIRKESERLTALINNILDFSRIEAGKKEYNFRETNLAELVRNTLESYRYQIEQKGFEFQQNIADDLPPLRLDREAIARSLLNLVNNALKYSQGDKFLGINVYRSNGVVKLEVIDRGIGIPRSEQQKIFEKFYRASDPLVHNTKGSGLGLSLVRHIVQAHGGQVSVESTPGQGSKFTIALPLDSDAGFAGAA